MTSDVKTSETPIEMFYRNTTCIGPGENPIKTKTKQTENN